MAMEVKVMKDIAKVRGKLAGGGWISLVNLGDPSKTLVAPVQPGGYVMTQDVVVTFENNNGTSMTASEESSNELEVGQYVNLVEVCMKVTGKEAHIRGKLDNDGWIPLLDMATGETCATPVQLGPYEIIYDAAVTSSIFLDSPGHGTLEKGEYVNIVEVKVLVPDVETRVGHRVRGRLADGGWISLVNMDTGEKTWAIPVPLGAYEIIHGSTKVGSDSVHSTSIAHLKPGQVVNVCETKIVTDIGRVRGRLAGGGWISLADLENGAKSWALPVLCGAYEIIHDATVSGTEQMNSPVIHTLRKGQFVQVLDYKFMEDIARLRGRIDGGGWISLVNLDNGEKTWAIPVFLGVYEIVSDAAVSRSELEVDYVIDTLTEGMYVYVEEAVVLPEIERIRGRLAGGGWISIAALESAGNKVWARHVQLGAYKLVHDVTITELENTDSPTIDTFQKGQYVNVDQVEILPDIGRVRARLQSGGWMSLANCNRGEKKWADPVPTGAYEICQDTVVTESESTGSRTVTSVFKGWFVYVSEVKVLEGVNRVRGRLDGGGWISLVNLDKSKTQWPSVVPLGAYQIIGDGTVTVSEFENDELVVVLEKGQQVDVAEIVVMEPIRRVRARLTGGGWISIANMETGEKMCIPTSKKGVMAQTNFGPVSMGTLAHNTEGDHPSQQGSEGGSGQMGSGQAGDSSGQQPRHVGFDPYIDAGARFDDMCEGGFNFAPYVDAIERLRLGGSSMNAPPGWESDWNDDVVMRIACWRADAGEPTCGLCSGDPCLYDLIEMYCKTHGQ